MCVSSISFFFVIVIVIRSLSRQTFLSFLFASAFCFLFFLHFIPFSTWSRHDCDDDDVCATLEIKRSILPIFRHVIPHSFHQIAVVCWACTALHIFVYFYTVYVAYIYAFFSTRTKECDYHQSDERKKKSKWNERRLNDDMCTVVTAICTYLCCCCSSSKNSSKQRCAGLVRRERWHFFAVPYAHRIRNNRKHK